MVDKKGIGYTIESILAIMTIFIFVFGGLNYVDDQNWSNFREEISYNDLSYTLYKSGYIDHVASKGQIGSMKTALNSLSERDVGLSGTLRNLPINENRVAFYVVKDNRYNQSIRQVTNSDPCYGQLRQITRNTREPVLRTENVSGSIQYGKENVTYIADTDPNKKSSDNKLNYDTVWVDNGSQCQFTSSEGPYYTEQIYKWEQEYYDIKKIDGSSTNKYITLYNATQPVEFRDELYKPLNSIKTFVEVDTVDFTRLDNQSYNTAIFRKNESVEDIENSDNRRIFEKFLNEGSVLILANLNQSFFDNGKILDDAGFRYLNVSYNGSYSGQASEGFFPGYKDASKVETYFKGLGEPRPLSIRPSTKVISDSNQYTESGKSLLKSQYKYNFSSWNAVDKSMTSVPTSISGLPSTNCLTGGTSDNLTEGSFKFPEETYDAINVRLGENNNVCKNNVRGIKIDLDKDGDYLENNEGVYLDGESLVVDDREYGINVLNSSAPGCNSKGDCVEFIYIGNSNVEVIPKRKFFPNLKGNKIALTGYENDYSKADIKLLSSIIYWLRGDELRFEQDRKSNAINTNVISSVQNRTYIPYKLNLRWKR